MIPRHCCAGRATRPLVSPTLTLAAAVGAAVAVCGAVVAQETAKPAAIVVTTSMLESAAREIVGEAREPSIVRLLPPASCPGHFDLSPRVLPQLRSAVAVIRHDYQGTLDSKIEEMGAGGVTTVATSTPGSLLIPENYLAVTRDIAAILAERFPARRDEFARSLARTRQRLDALGAEIQAAASGWKNTPVIAAQNQEDFCRWLGLRVVGAFGRPEEITPREYEQLLALQAVVIVANLQEGTQAAVALGERKTLPVVVFSNFPGAEGYGEGYDALVRENIRRFREALP